MITAWRKSSYSGTHNQSECVEVGTGPGVIGIRDTKNRPAGHLSVPRTAWRAFLRTVRR